MIQLGTALKSQEPPFHRCLVISDPQNNGGMVVLVRVTTDDGTWPDRDCILTPADWAELDHDSTAPFPPVNSARRQNRWKRRFSVDCSSRFLLLRPLRCAR
jgi:hypothetical protein